MVEKNEEKEEFLKREEIRTMYKDIVRLQEEEALTERERIAGLKTEEELRKERERKEELERKELEMEKAREEAEKWKEIIRKAKEEEIKEEEIKKTEEAEKKRKEKILEERRLERERAWQLEEEERKKLLERLRATKALKEKKISEKAREVLVPRPVLKRPSVLEKIFIRVLILLLLFGFFGLLFAFWYWYFRVKMAPITPPPVEEIIPLPEETKEETKEEIKEEVNIPPSLIVVEGEEILEISKIEEIPEKINQALTKEMTKGSFERILIKDLVKNELVSLKDLLAAFQINTPANFYQKLGENYTFFIFSQEDGKRLGLIAEIKEKEGFSDLLKSWEATMEKDFENLFKLLGKKAPALSATFKDGEHQGVGFRFQTFTRQDLGICYSLFDNYFLFTSSGESLTNTIDKLMTK